jgi:thymidylate kinase
MKIIAVTGIDGTGKTTTARTLHKTLNDAGYKVIYRHQFQTIFAYLFNLGRGIFLSKNEKSVSLNSDSNQSNNGDKKINPLKKSLVYVYVFFKALQTQVHRFSSYEIVIFDRFIFDDFVRFRQRYDLNLGYLRFLYFIVYKPSLIVNLFGDVSTTFNRQVDIDSSFEMYLQKLEIHNLVLEDLGRNNYRILSLNSVKLDNEQVVKKIINYKGFSNDHL